MKLLVPLALLAAFVAAAPAPPNSTSPSSSSPAPVSSTISFPIPTMLPNEYANSYVYRAIYNAVANLDLMTVNPLPSSCPYWLTDATMASDRYTTAIQNESDVSQAVLHFNQRYDVTGFNTSAIIDYFNTSVAPLEIITPDQQRVYESELEIIRAVNVRNDWYADYSQCFSVNTSVVDPTGTLPTPAPVGTDTFTAQASGVIDQSALYGNIRGYFSLVQGSVPNFTVSVNETTNVVTITITEAAGSHEAALAAQSLADMPASYQSSLGIYGLAASEPSPATNSPSSGPSPTVPAPHSSSKKFPLWVVGVIVGALVFLALAALVISRRNSNHGPTDNFRDNATDELNTQNGDYLRV